MFRQSSSKLDMFQRRRTKDSSKRRTFKVDSRNTMGAIVDLYHRVRQYGSLKNPLPSLIGRRRPLERPECDQVYGPTTQETLTSDAEVGTDQKTADDQQLECEKASLEPTQATSTTHAEGENDLKTTDDQQPECKNISMASIHETPTTLPELANDLENAHDQQAVSENGVHYPSEDPQPEDWAPEAEADQQYEDRDETAGDGDNNNDDQHPLFETSEQIQEVPNELEDWDPEAEQAMRDSKYVKFTDEAEEDYTPVTRFVLGSDGVTQCAALLITYDLAQKIKKSSEMQRLFSREQRYAEAQEEEIDEFRSKLRSEILNHEARISHEEANGGAEAVEALQKELEVLELLVIDMDNRRDTVAMNLKMKADLVIKAQAQVAKILDEAFVYAELLEPQREDELPVESFDLQQEYQKMYSSLEHPEDDFDVFEEGPMEVHSSAPLLDTSRDHLEYRMPTPTPEEQAAQDISIAFWQAKDRVEKAQEQFDMKELERSREHQNNLQAWYSGEDALDVDQESFDLRWKVRIGEITHELVEAEAALKEARIAAHEAEVDLLLDDQSQCFADYPEDGRHGLGYDASDEEKDTFFAITRDDTRINAWLNGVERTSEPEAQQCQPAGIDDWPYKEVDLCDSRSMVAFESTRREQIDRWQRISPFISGC